MREMNGHAGLAADRNRFADRAEQADRIAGFVALMRVVQPAANGGFARNGDDLVGLGKTLRRVEEAGGKAGRAFAHALGHQRLHRMQFLRIGGAGVLTQDLLAHRAEADEGDEIGADARGFDSGGIGADIGRAIAIDADDHGADALVEPGGIDALGRVGRAQEAIGMRVGVDEAGRDDHPARVDPLRRLHRRGAADIDDPVALQRDVADIGLARAAIIDGAAGDQDIGLRRRGSAARRDRAGQAARQQQSADRAAKGTAGERMRHERGSLAG